MRIIRFTATPRQCAFFRSESLQSACPRGINSIRAIRFRGIRYRGLRNVVAHEYGSIDSESLWETVTEDIPQLYEFCKEQILQIPPKS
ncbi:MAG: DUF86 domain-containing protein [Oscillospiraceae bacterium]|nr:DUF86 domain-containing protein [Oscillospiraceae bacterium]